MDVLFDREPHPGKPAFRFPEQIAERVFAFMEDYDVVAVARITPESRIFHETVISGKIVVRQQLRKVIPDWQSRRMRFDDLVEEFQYQLVFDLVPEHVFQDVAVDVLIVFLRVHFQDVERSALERRDKMDHPLNTLMDAALLDARIRVFDPGLDKVSSGDLFYRMLDDVIHETGIPIDLSDLLPVPLIELSVAPHFPFPGNEGFLQLLDVPV